MSPRPSRGKGLASVACVASVVLVAAGCSHDWDILDPRLAAEGASSSSGAGGASSSSTSSGAGGASSSSGASSSTSSSTGSSSSSGGGASSSSSSSASSSGMATLPVSLGMAEGFAILTRSGISNVPTSAITGNLGVSPGALTYITGFTLTPHMGNVYSTSPEVTGMIYAADGAVPTPSNLMTAVGDMQVAFTDAAARTPDVNGLGAGNIGGMTLAPGVYSWTTGLLIPANVTLTGTAKDVWILQIAQDVTVSSAVKVFLTGGALPRNVFWQVAGKVVLGTGAHFEGVVLTQTSVALATGASINGRLLAQTAVTLDSSTVVEPNP